MARMTRMTGVDKVLASLRRAKDPVGDGIARGLNKAGLVLLKKSKEIVPVQLGNLKASSFIRGVGRGFKRDVTVGYTANYAVYVHENIMAVHGAVFNQKYAEKISAAQGTKGGTAKGGWFNRGEDQQAKFLETPARRLRRKLIHIIAREGKKRL